MASIHGQLRQLGKSTIHHSHVSSNLISKGCQLGRQQHDLGNDNMTILAKRIYAMIEAELIDHGIVKATNRLPLDHIVASVGHAAVASWDACLFGVQDYYGCQD